MSEICGGILSQTQSKTTKQGIRILLNVFVCGSTQLEYVEMDVNKSLRYTAPGPEIRALSEYRRINSL